MSYKSYQIIIASKRAVLVFARQSTYKSNLNLWIATLTPCACKKLAYFLSSG